MPECVCTYEKSQNKSFARFGQLKIPNLRTTTTGLSLIVVSIKNFQIIKAEHTTIPRLMI
jgi:hypothetical protein